MIYHVKEVGKLRFGFSSIACVFLQTVIGPKGTRVFLQSPVLCPKPVHVGLLAYKVNVGEAARECADISLSV